LWTIATLATSENWKRKFNNNLFLKNKNKKDLACQVIIGNF